MSVSAAARKAKHAAITPARIISAPSSRTANPASKRSISTGFSLGMYPTQREAAKFAVVRSAGVKIKSVGHG
jgi:hypothetical protein